MKLFAIIIISTFCGAIAGGASYYLLEQQNNPYKEFYDIETSVVVSPHSLRKMMDKQDTSFILVDLRSEEEYLADHIKGAINIPAYKDKDTSAYGDKERIVNSFKELPSGKDIIVYCYSTPCMTGRKVGKMLADEGIYVKHLGIGWNDWKYDWTAWNHEHEWNLTNSSMYIVSGNETVPEGAAGCPASGDFGC